MPFMDNAIILGQLLRKHNLTLSVAESCTGGLIAKLITDVPNSSLYFHSGVVTYSNTSKTLFLEVSPSILELYGAVSPQCAEAMVRGLKLKTGSDLCLATTGIAGPTGGTPEKPVGLVYSGFYLKDKLTVEKLFFRGNRALIRMQTANFCLKYLIEYLTHG